MSEWVAKIISDLCEINQETYSVKENWSYINYLDTGNLTENKIETIQRLDVASDTVPSRARRKVKKNDLLYSTIRPNHKHFGLIKNPVDNMLASTGFAVLSAKKDVADPSYIYWYLSQNHIVNFLHSVADNSTSTYPSLKPSDIGRLEITLPDSIEEQQKISGILDNLQCKIENNRRMNETLEGMAQAIFKSWFVDFDPVHAKVEALKAGGSEEDARLEAMCAISGKSADDLATLKIEHPKGYTELATTADAFPSAFTDSPLGSIPAGWEVKTFGDVSNCYDNKRIPLSKRHREKRSGNIPYYGATSIMDYVNEPIFDGIYLLLGEDGSVLKEDGTPFTQYIWGKSWVNNHAHVLQGTNGISTEHLLTFISRTNIAAYITGAVQLKLNQRNMNSIPFLKANQAINQSFDIILQALFEAYRNNSEEIKSLAETRDALLPKLLSGEIDVSNIEDKIKEAI